MSDNVSNQGSQEPKESSSQSNQAADDKEIKTEPMEVDPSNGEEVNEGVKEEPRESLISQLNQASYDKEIKIKTESMQVDPSDGSNEGVKEEPRESLSQMNQVSDDEEIKSFAIKTEFSQPQPSGGDAADENGLVHTESNMGGLTDLLVASIYQYSSDHFGEDGSDENKLSDLERQILSNVGVSADSNGVVGDNENGGGVPANGVVADGSMAVAGGYEPMLAKGKMKCEGDDGVVQPKFVFRLFGFNVYAYEKEVGNNVGKSASEGGAGGIGGSSASGGGSSFKGGTDGSAGGSSSNDGNVVPVIAPVMGKSNVDFDSLDLIFRAN